MKANGQTAWVDNDGKVCSITDRHPATQQIEYWLEPNPNLPVTQQAIASHLHGCAVFLLSQIDDGPELTVALRKLLEAKDAAVRASMETGSL